MTTHPAVISTRVLPRTRVTTGALVVGFALLTAAAAQIEVPLWFTPVPVTGQTFAVLLTGAALGMRAGAASQALYVALGATGLPFYSGGDGGWEAATGATAGYLVGFIAAAALIGWLAERRNDRRVVTALPAFAASSLLIYVLGATWLAISLNVGAGRALELGVTPFILGDLLKAGLAAVALPAAWRLAERRDSDG